MRVVRASRGMERETPTTRSSLLCDSLPPPRSLR